MKNLLRLVYGLVGGLISAVLFVYAFRLNVLVGGLIGIEDEEMVMAFGGGAVLMEVLGMLVAGMCICEVEKSDKTLPGDEG